MKKSITWGSVRNKNLKALLLSEYVLQVQHELGLSIQEAKQLKDFINKGILLKYINSKDIILNDDGTKIDEIQGINIEEKIYENKSYSNSIDNIEDKYYQYFCDHWYQFIVNLNRSFRNN